MMTKRTSPSPNEKRGVTIADVAKAAGVSVPTVSRILNDKEYVAEETRQRVEETIRKLGYTPHTQARRLRGGASMTLALHHPIETPHELSSVIETPYITGAAAAARAAVRSRPARRGSRRTAPAARAAAVPPGQTAALYRETGCA